MTKAPRAAPLPPSPENAWLLSLEVIFDAPVISAGCVVGSAHLPIESISVK